MVMISFWQMLLAMLAATVLYDLTKTLYKYWSYYRQVRRINSEVARHGGRPIGYVEVKQDGTMLEHIFDANYKFRDKSN